MSVNKCLQRLWLGCWPKCCVVVRLNTMRKHLMNRATFGYLSEALTLCLIEFTRYMNVAGRQVLRSTSSVTRGTTQWGPDRRTWRPATSNHSRFDMHIREFKRPGIPQRGRCLTWLSLKGCSQPTVADPGYVRPALPKSRKAKLLTLSRQWWIQGKALH